MKKKASIGERIRHRFIKAMGGYTEQFTPIERPPKINVQTGNIRKIAGMVEIPLPEVTAFGTEKAEEFARQRLLYEICKALNSEQIIQITAEESYGGKKVLRAELEVVDKPREQL